MNLALFATCKLRPTLSFYHTLNASYLTPAMVYIEHAVSLLPSRVSYASYKLVTRAFG